MPVIIEVRMNRLPEIAGMVEPAYKQAQQESLQEIVTEAQGRARRDTGAMAGGTVVEGEDTAHATMFYSGFHNFGTSRGISADHWFSAPAEDQATKFPARIETALRGAFG